MNQFQIKTVNKFESDWAAITLFSQQYKIRATILYDTNLLVKINKLVKLKISLGKDYGLEDDNWKIIERCPLATDLYMKDSGALVLWKLQDSDLLDLFDRIEQHESNDAL